MTFYSVHIGVLYNLVYFRQHYRHFGWAYVTLQLKVRLRTVVTVCIVPKQQQ